MGIVLRNLQLLPSCMNSSPKTMRCWRTGINMYIHCSCKCKSFIAKIYISFFQSFFVEHSGGMYRILFSGLHGRGLLLKTLPDVSSPSVSGILRSDIFGTLQHCGRGRELDSDLADSVVFEIRLLSPRYWGCWSTLLDVGQRNRRSWSPAPSPYRSVEECRKVEDATHRWQRKVGQSFQLQTTTIKPVEQNSTQRWPWKPKSI